MISSDHIIIFVLFLPSYDGNDDVESIYILFIVTLLFCHHFVIILYQDIILINFHLCYLPLLFVSLFFNHVSWLVIFLTHWQHHCMSWFWFFVIDTYHFSSKRWYQHCLYLYLSDFLFVMLKTSSLRGLITVSSWGMLRPFKSVSALVVVFLSFKLMGSDSATLFYTSHRLLLEILTSRGHQSRRDWWPTEVSIHAVIGGLMR